MMDLRFFVRTIEAYIQKHLESYITELRDICAIDSGSEHKLGLDRIAAYLGTRMSQLGMQVRVVEGDTWGNDIVGTLSGGGNGIVTLLGHTDTVYPPGIAAARPLRKEGNILYAPGVSDMKGCILAAIYTIEAMLAVGYRDFGEIRLLCVSDEEISRRHSEELIYQICEKSSAVFVLEAARANGNIVSARKGTAWYSLRAQGRAAHAGVEPEKGNNAVIEVAHQILQFASLQGWREGLSICPGVVNGGSVPNVVPDHASARFDLRYLHPVDRVDTESQWRAFMQQKRVFQVELTLELEAYRDPMVSTFEGLRLVEKAQEIAQMLGFSLNHAVSGGTSDGRYASALGLPVLDGLGPVGGLDHSPDEYLMVDSVPQRAALLAGLLADVAWSR